MSAINHIKKNMVREREKKILEKIRNGKKEGFIQIREKVERRDQDLRGKKTRNIENTSKNIHQKKRKYT